MLGKIILLVVLALGISLAVPSTRAIVMEKAAPVMNGVKAKLVPSRLETMADQLEVRVSRGEGFPSSWESWLRREYSGVPEDPWGSFYYLQVSRRSFTVGSMGPDGVEGNEDDMTVTRQLGR